MGEAAVDSAAAVSRAVEEGSSDSVSLSISYKHLAKSIGDGNGGDDNAQWSRGDHGAENRKDKPTVCLNTAVSTAGHGFSGIGSDLGPDGLNH